MQPGAVLAPADDLRHALARAMSSCGVAHSCCLIREQPRLSLTNLDDAAGLRHAEDGMAGPSFHTLVVGGVDHGSTTGRIGADLNVDELALCRGASPQAP